MPRYFFVHLLKTGGTALLMRLRQQFGADAVYPTEHDGPVDKRTIDVENLLGVWSRRGADIQVITGHFPFATMELLDADFATFTLLRDPVERTLSFLRQQRQEDPRWRDRPLEEIYEDPFVHHGLVRDHMTKMFALDADDARRAGLLSEVTLDEGDLDRALARLATVDVVGVQEDHERFVAALADRFGWDLGRPAWANRTAPVPVDDAFRRRIRADNRLDVALYEQARRLVPPPHPGAA